MFKLKEVKVISEREFVILLTCWRQHMQVWLVNPRFKNLYRISPGGIPLKNNLLYALGMILLVDQRLNDKHVYIDQYYMMQNYYSIANPHPMLVLYGMQIADCTGLKQHPK